MKVAIAIPIYNEQEIIEKCLKIVGDEISKLRKKFEIDIICVNDGSDDNSFKIINESDQKLIILSNEVNFGLSEVFNSIMYFVKKNNYEYLIIFDADLQYSISDANNLLSYALNDKIDLLIGSRDFKKSKNFSFIKRKIQIIGSKFISLILGEKIFDATSGYRVYSRKAINSLFTTNSFTYTLETIFQSKEIKLKIGSLKLSNFFATRKSRLFKSNSEYIYKSLFVLIKSIILYKKKVLKKIVLVISIPGFYLLSRFFIPFFNKGYNNGNIQSLIFGSTYLLILLLVILIAFQFVNYIHMMKKLMLIDFQPKHTLIEK